MKNNPRRKKVRIIGAGLAGCESAWFLAEKGIDVELYEMRPNVQTPAHRTSGFAELICSNSLKSNSLDNASGLLKEELRRLGSFLIKTADSMSIPGGKALVVDRERFSLKVTKLIENHPRIEVKREEVVSIDNGDPLIIASGPLTSDNLLARIEKLVGTEFLSFYDAIAPIVDGETIDMGTAFFADRYGNGDGDYLNCPMNRDEFEVFYNELIRAEGLNEKDFEKLTFFEGCLPIEEIGRRGKDSLRYGPMRPVGLNGPSGERYYAVVQLRRENTAGRSFNLVGFQTRLKHGAQERIIYLIPGLKNAKILRYGAMHRNSFINSPAVLDGCLRLKKNPDIYFAGQITGSEGYVESVATGLFCAINLSRYLSGDSPVQFPRSTAIGGLLDYITNPENSRSFQPMNINFGLIEQPENMLKRKERRTEAVNSALLEIDKKADIIK